MRKQTLSSLLLACLVVLVGCDNSAPPKDPTPSAESRNNTENALLATSKLGKPLELDGCIVQAYEVNVAYPGVRSDRYFTLATANCPTADVKTTRQSCGKNCEHDVLSVTRKAEDVGKAEEKAKAEAAAKKAELLKKREQLVSELQALEAEIEPAK